MSARRPRLDFRPDIEGLRGIAVSLVVAYHAGVPGISGGFVGVDVFFVVSGYLITQLLLTEIAGTGRIDLPAFFARRVRRLLPLALLVVAATMVGSMLVHAPVTQIEVAKTAFAATIYLSNVHFAFEATDYLGQSITTNPLLHMWSLSVEEQFYLVWPALLALVVRGARLRPRAAVFVLASTVLGASLLVSIALTRSDPDWSFYMVHARAWEFAAGAVAGFLAARPGWLGRRWGAAIGWIGVALVVASAVRLTDASSFPGLNAVPTVVGTVLILLAGVAAPDRGAPVLLGSLGLQFLGRVSYGWYLWHWPALVLVTAQSGDIGLGGRLIVSTLALVLAWFSYRWMEQPIRHHPKLVGSVRASFATLGIATAVVASGLVGWRVGVEAVAGPSQEEILAARADIPRLYPDQCHRAYATVEVSDCVFGYADGATRVALVGDSHAAQWFPALERIAGWREWRLEPHTKSSCPAAFVSLEVRAGTPYTECADWLGAVVEHLGSLRPAIVFLSSYASAYGLSEEDWLRGAGAFVRQIEALGARVVLIRDPPAPGFDVVECLSDAAWRSRAARSACSFDPTPTQITHLWEEELAASFPTMALVDVRSAVCPGASCAPAVGGAVVFRDEHHLTASFAASLAPLVDSSLESLGLATSSRMPSDGSLDPASPPARTGE